MILKQLQKQYVIFFYVGHRPTGPTIAIFRHFCRLEQYLTYRPTKNSFDLQNLHRPTDLHYVGNIYYLIRKLYIYLSHKELCILFVLKYFYVVGL